VAAVAGGDAGIFGVIYAQIMAGVPDSFYQLGDAYAVVLTSLQKVQGEIPDEMGRLANNWSGPAATTFGKVGEQITTFIGDTAGAITNDEAVMDACGDALKVAQKAIEALVADWNNQVQNPEFNPDLAAWDDAAQQILATVSDAYRAQGGNLKAIKEDPGDITANGEGVDDPGADGDGDLPEDDEDVPGDEEDVPGEEPPAGGGGPGDNALLAPGGEPLGPDGEPIGPDGEPIGPGGDPTGLGAPVIPGGPGTNGLQIDGPGDPGDPTDDGPFGGGPGGPDFLTSPSDGDGPTPPELQGIGNPDGDPSTKLSSFEPGGPNLTAPSPVGGGDLPTTLTSAPNAGGTGPGGGGGPSGGPGGRPLIGPIGPGSQLTSAGLRGGPGGTPSARGSRGGPGTGGPVGPGSTLTSAGGRSRSGATRSKRGGLGGFGDPDDTGYFPARAIGDTDDEAEERESWLLGDEEWDDSEALESSIGRPGGDHADVGS
jgi:hypothetical protein